MRTCPRCSTAYDDDTRICRTCGAILEDLEDVAEEPLVEVEVVDEGESPSEPEGTPEEFPSVEELEGLGGAGTPGSGANWRCPKCRETVPNMFDVCWKCGLDRGGAVAGDSVEQPIEVDLPDRPEAIAPEPVAPRVRSLQCPVCGSSKVIPQVRIVDQGEQSTGSLRVVIYGDPGALIFKDRLYGELTATICGDCGQVELRVANPGELYRHYLQSRR